MKLINVMGTNGSGKSTRVDALVKYLDTKMEAKLVHMDCKNGHKEIGRIYGDLFILGRLNNSGKWIGLDLADFCTFQSRLDLYKTISESYPEVKTFLQEGYFNNGSKKATKETLSEYNVSSYVYYVFVYDTIEQFIERCNGRTGKSRGLEWAEKSAGWNDNKSFNGVFEFYDKLKEEDCVVHKYDISAPRDLLVRELFNDTFEIPKEINEPKDW